MEYYSLRRDFRSIVFARKGGYRPKAHIMERYSVIRIRYSFLMGPLDINFQQYVPHGFILRSEISQSCLLHKVPAMSSLMLPGESMETATMHRHGFD
jgi:hypothetical protein